MGKNIILVDSGYGRYLRNDKPKAIANEFFYFNPSLLLWTDEMICDVNALHEEMIWSNKGFLVSELSIELMKMNIIKSQDFSQVITAEVKDHLLKASQLDVRKAVNEKLLPYSTPDLNNMNESTDNRFDDINSLLYLSAKMEAPFLNTNPANKYFQWKFQSWQNEALATKNTIHRKSSAALSHILDFYVPQFEVFPKTKRFFEAEKTKKRFLRLSKLYAKKEISKVKFEREYHIYLDQWLKYDNSVRSEAKENFYLLLDLKKGNKLKAVRKFLQYFAEELLSDPEDKEFKRQVIIKLKKELIEAEAALASVSEKFETFDKYKTYFSAPIQITTSIAGAAISSLTQNPFFIALGCTPSVGDIIGTTLKSNQVNKYSWYLYLHDFKKKVTTAKELRELRKKF